MTTIVAVETKEGVTLAGDSRGTGPAVNDGWLTKIFENGGITFGVSGYIRIMQLLQYAKLPELPKTNNHKKIEKWITQSLIPAWLAIDKQMSEIEKDWANSSGAIAVIKGRAYTIEPGGGWTRSSQGFYAIGSGSRFALGALAAGATAKQAVKIASRFDAATNDQVHVVSIKA